MILMDVFLGGMFSTYGSQVWSISEMDPENRSDPMNLVFPKVSSLLLFQQPCHSVYSSVRFMS